MTLQEFKVYLDALIEETGDERLKRVRAKADEIIGPLPDYYPTVWPSVQPLTAPVPHLFPYTTCGSANVETIEGAAVQ